MASFEVDGSRNSLPAGIPKPKRGNMERKGFLEREKEKYWKGGNFFFSGTQAALTFTHTQRNLLSSNALFACEELLKREKTSHSALRDFRKKSKEGPR